MQDLRCCWASSSCGRLGLLFVVCSFSLRWLLLLRSTGSKMRGLMWDLPGPVIEPMSPALAGGFLATRAPGKSSINSLKSMTPRSSGGVGSCSCALGLSLLPGMFTHLTLKLTSQGPALGPFFKRDCPEDPSPLCSQGSVCTSLPTGLFHASCLLICLPRGARSFLGTELSLIHLWEPRCSQGPHRADSWRMCLEWDINAGSQTFSECAFGSNEARSPACSWEGFAGRLPTGATV